jgi:hypothetical protein
MKRPSSFIRFRGRYFSREAVISGVLFALAAGAMIALRVAARQDPPIITGECWRRYQAAKTAADTIAVDASPVAAKDSLLRTCGALRSRTRR